MDDKLYDLILNLSHQGHQDVSAAAHNAGWNDEASQDLLSSGIQRLAQCDALLEAYDLTLDQVVLLWLGDTGA